MPVNVCVALDALCIWAEPALLASVYEQLYEQVAALLTQSDGEALNSAIDWANVYSRLKSTPVLYALVKEVPVKHFSEEHCCGQSLCDF